MFCAAGKTNLCGVALLKTTEYFIMHEVVVANKKKIEKENKPTYRHLHRKFLLLFHFECRLRCFFLIILS